MTERTKVWVVHTTAREIYEGTVYGSRPPTDEFYVALSYKNVTEMMTLLDEHLFFDKDEAKKILFKLNLSEESKTKNFEWIEDEDLYCRP